MMRRIARRMASCRPEVKLFFPEREIGEAQVPASRNEVATLLGSLLFD
jgi:hypothetical protein